MNAADSFLGNYKLSKKNPNNIEKYRPKTINVIVTPQNYHFS